MIGDLTVLLFIFAFDAIQTHGFLASVPDEELPAELSGRTDLVDCVHYYKDAMLGTFYAICNCCACCCGAMNAHQHGTPMLASSGYVAVVDGELCAGCGVRAKMWR